MASMALRKTAFFFTFNLLFFTLIRSDPLPEATCPIEGLKFSVCANLLNNLVHGIVVGTPPSSPCCDLIYGLVNLDAAACLCKAFKANLLGVELNASASLSLLLNKCGKEVPSGFQCA